MMTKGEQFAGLTVAFVTPFRNGAVDEAALRKLVDFHIEQGTNCVSPVGTTGESPTLSHDEHEQVISTVCDHAAGRIKVMAGTGSNSTAEAIRLTRVRQKGRRGCGADGRSVLQQADARGILLALQGGRRSGRHSACALQYSRPDGKNIEAGHDRPPRRIPNIVMVKESTGSLDQASQIHRRHRT